MHPTRTKLASIILSAAALTMACSGSESKSLRTLGSSRSSTDAVTQPSPGESPDPHHPHPPQTRPSDPSALPSPPPGLALRNFDQLNATMAILTGIPATTPNIQSLYQTQLKELLPTNQSVTEFKGSVQVGIFKLAVEYCDAMINAEIQQPKIFRNVKITAVPAVAFDSAGKSSFIKALTDQFWLLSPGDRDASAKELESLLDELTRGRSLTTAAQTAAVAKAGCTAALAAAPVTFY